MAAENFLVTAVLEAELIVDDLQRSLAEQRGLLAFSAQQQEAGLQRSLVSTQAISKTTIDFFNDLESQSSMLITNLEGSRMERSCQLADMEKKFKELSAQEDKAALEKIAGILTNLAAVKTNMVSVAVENMNDTSLETKKTLQQDISSMQKVSENAKAEWIGYIDKVGSDLQEDASSNTETRQTMEKTLQYCSEKVGQSMQHWKSAQLSTDQLHKDYISSVVTRNHENNNVLEEFMSVSARADREFDTARCELLTTSKHSLSLDHEAIKEVESMSAMCLDDLKTLQGNHNEGVKDIRILADRYLLKEYLIDDSTRTTPVKKNINVPSLASMKH